MDIVKVVLEIILCIFPIYFSIKRGPIGLIGMSGVSILVLVFLLRLDPAAPPLGAIFIVLTVILASSALLAAGGLDYLVRVAAGLMRKRPQQIGVLGPLLVFVFSLLSGTGNIAFALYPVVCELSYANGVRPERTLSTSVILAQLALVASPVAALTATYLTLVEPTGFTLGKILVITFPAALIAAVVTALVMSRWGKDLSKDTEYQRRLAAGEIEPPVSVSRGADSPALPRGAGAGAGIFVGGVVVVVLLGLITALRPSFTVDGVTEAVSMSVTIPIVMIAVTGLITLVTRVSSKAVMAADVLKPGFIAAMILLTVPVLFGTVINAHLTAISDAIDSALGITVAFFAVVIFIVGALVMSMAAAVQIVVPIALVAGLSVYPMTGMLAAASGNNLLASISGAGQDVIELDKTGTTHGGKFIVDSSFTAPLLISVVIAVAVGLGIASLIG